MPPARLGDLDFLCKKYPFSWYVWIPPLFSGQHVWLASKSWMFTISHWWKKVGWERFRSLNVIWSYFRMSLWVKTWKRKKTRGLTKACCSFKWSSDVFSWCKANSRNYLGTHVRLEKVGGDIQWVGLDWVGVDCTGQINDPARSKNSSLALCPPFTQNFCHS